MDLSAIHAALSAKSYSTLGPLCDDLLLQVASRGAATDDWPYAVHLLAHLYLNDLNSARFLWKTVPQEVKDARPELAAIWKIGQCLWNRDYAGVYTTAHEFEWSPEIADFVAGFLDAVQNGWSLDAATKMLTVRKQKAQTNQKLDASKLQRLTECVFHLEH
ncbi:COP9 signalosome complex subunit 8 isoform X2 [Brachypodium distachyon]|uniref:COP9 signalosome complex subunit 8 isoform X2 n=1 Tax=Brachypodium distachyon TaxID=15368 RepID=UPI0001C6FE2F|nr:COP9 signalosome complex subunit 8 isoform X2 [Brachypodium distachyon]|eukprot:XP_010239910.1 COP9 signalosome complex subunit 8 isoform X2 [Brachypodium distachyon]